MNLRQWNKLLGKLMVYIGNLIAIAGIVYNDWFILIVGLILLIFGGIGHELNEGMEER